MTISYRWIGAYHWTKGRQGKPITGIVIHWMAGTLASTDATFLGGEREASAHYGVEGTTIHGYVRTADTAWALGVWESNLRTISIEVSAQPGRDASPETLNTVIGLITDLCRDHGLTAANISKHNDYKATQCPGTVPVEAIRAAVANNLTVKSVDLQKKDVKSKMLVITQAKGDPAIWIGDGITRRWIPNIVTLEDYRKLATWGVLTIFRNGEVMDYPPAVLGTPVGPVS